MSHIKMRCLEKKDFLNLADFLKEGFKSNSLDIWINRFSMWWLDNPAMNPSIPYGWVLENNNSEIVGFFGNIPVKYQINGKTGIAVAGTSLYVDPSVRGIASLQLILAFIKQKNVEFLLNSSSNETSKKIFLKFGFSDSGVLFNNTEYYYVRDYEKMLYSIMKKYVKSCKLFFLIKISFIPIKLISSFLRWSKDEKIFNSQHNDFNCSICTSCDDSFTNLWNSDKKENVTTLCRDSETLNWLYFSKYLADRRYVIKCNDVRNNKLVGYFVFDVIHSSDKNSKIMRLRDFYIPQLEEEIVLSLISFSMDFAKEFDVAALVFWSTNLKMDQILKKNFKIRRKNKYMGLYKYVYHGYDSNSVINMGNTFVPSLIDPDRGTI